MCAWQGRTKMRVCRTWTPENAVVWGLNLPPFCCRRSRQCCLPSFLQRQGARELGRSPRGDVWCLVQVIFTCPQQTQAHQGQGLAMSQEPSQTPLQLCPYFLAHTRYARRSSNVTLPFFSLVCPNLTPASLVSSNNLGHGDIFQF